MNILITNASIITQNRQRKYIPRGFVIIDGNEIKRVGSGDPNTADLKSEYHVIDAKGLFVLPGFINAHVHLGESIFQGLLKGQHSLEDYLRETEKIIEKTDLIEKERGASANYSLMKLIRTGTTTICGGRVANYANQWGVRNKSCYMVMNSSKLKKFSINLQEQYTEEYKKNKDVDISYPAIFIHSLNKIDVGTISSAKKILKKFPDTILTLHIAETKKQEKEVRRKFGMGSVDFLYKNGLLNKKTVLVHCNWLSQKDLSLIKKCKASIVQCLSSNINVADRVLNLKDVIKRDIKICLATDGVATSGTFSVLDEAKRCFLYYQRKRGQYNITEQKCLDLITIEAARVLSLDDVIGSIERNKRADLVFCRKLNKKSLFKSIGDISGVIIDGNVKMWENKLLIFNDKKITEKFFEVLNRVKASI